MKRSVLIPLLVIAFIAFFSLFWLSEVIAGIRDRLIIQQAYERAVRPATEWVRSFHQRHGHLPTDTELDNYAKTKWPGYIVGIYDSPPKWQHSWGQPGVDFMICIHTGEWNLYRQSWDGGEWKAWTD